MTAELTHHGTQVNALRGALADGEHGLGSVPGLVARVCDEGSWRSFEFKGVTYRNETWAEFVAARPLKGLGSTPEMLQRICHGQPEVLRRIRAAAKVGKGKRTDLTPQVDSTPSHPKGVQDSAVAAQRLAEQHPEEYAAVERGEKTLHAAALDAGIRRPRVLVRLDDATSAAQTLRKHMPPEVLAELLALLGGAS